MHINNIKKYQDVCLYVCVKRKISLTAEPICFSYAVMLLIGLQEGLYIFCERVPPPSHLKSPPEKNNPSPREIWEYTEYVNRSRQNHSKGNLSVISN